MKSKINTNKIQEELRNIVSFKSDKEKLEFETSVIQLGIMQELQMIMDKKGLSRSDLADIVDKSKSFITQLFTGDKHLSLKHIAEFQRALKIKINVSFQFNLIEQFSQECLNSKMNFPNRDSLVKPIFQHDFNQSFLIKGSGNIMDKTA